jgi:hypothetical protein
VNTEYIYNLGRTDGQNTAESEPGLSLAKQIVVIIQFVRALNLKEDYAVESFTEWFLTGYGTEEVEA